MFVNQWMAKQNVRCTYGEILFSNKWNEILICTTHSVNQLGFGEISWTKKTTIIYKISRRRKSLSIGSTSVVVELGCVWVRIDYNLEILGGI
jgi:hypothetical protein